MRVLHLSTWDRLGGAAIAAYRQHQGLQRAGVQSRMWVKFKATSDPEVVVLQPSSALGFRLPRVLRRRYLKFRMPGRDTRRPFSDDRSEYHACVGKELPPHDVVNLHWAAGFIDQPSLFHLIPRETPIVVTMHDMNPFTGGCHYSAGCSRFTEKCGKCPELGSGKERDLSRAIWTRKFRSYRLRPQSKLHFVADSHWLAAEARTSSLLANMPISVIHYGLDTEVFRLLDRAFARFVLGIPPQVAVVSFAAAAVDEERKGMHHLVEALMGMTTKPFLLTWGRSFPPRLETISHRHLGNIESEHLMALAYSASDVFVMPSLQEAFGQTALEAMACGTPVAAFGAGGIVDTVRHEQTGLVATVGSSPELRACISRLLRDRELWQSCSGEAVHMAATAFSLDLNARRYVELYESLLAKN
jgi:glycosyltransferase involved in cell wall biosynthesis